MRQLFETRDFQETGLQPMADPAGLSAAVLVGELCGQDIPVFAMGILPKSRFVRHIQTAREFNGENWPHQQS